MGKKSAGRYPERSPGGSREKQRAGWDGRDGERRGWKGRGQEAREEKRRGAKRSEGERRGEDGRERPSGQLDEGPPAAPAEPRTGGAALAGALGQAPEGYVAFMPIRATDRAADRIGYPLLSSQTGKIWKLSARVPFSPHNRLKHI